MTLNEKKKLYKEASNAYYNDEPIMSDREFDKLEKEIKAADPTWSQLKKTGMKVADKKIEVRLPEFMPSLNKIYPEHLEKWRAKRKDQVLTLLMHKLDGSALIGRFVNGKPIFLATRGDGTYGGDISFLIPYLNLPTLLDKSDVTIRFEAVMKTATFEKKWSRKAKGDEGFDNSRNMVNGLLNRKTPHPGLKDIDIVVLGVYDRPMLKGLQWAIRQGLKVVEHYSIGIEADFEKSLAKARKDSAYDIDGLVLVDPRQNFHYANADKPKWIHAFKVNADEDAVEATVKDIIWQESRTGRWTPKIEVEPVKMKGVTVTYATAHNAVWMNERRIGVGAVVKLTRAGDVIPKILDVAKKAKDPSHPPGEFYEKGVHYYNNATSKEAQVREIHHFFSTLGIEHIAAKTIGKLYDKGFTDIRSYLAAFTDNRRVRLEDSYPGIKSVIHATVGMQSVVEAGLGWTMAAKIWADISRVLVDEGVSLIKLMNASNCFESFGERKLQMVQDHFMASGDPDPLKGFVKMSAANLASKRNWGQIELIKGMGAKSAAQFFQGMLEFKEWFAPILKLKLIKVNAPEQKKAKTSKGGKFAGQYVSWTGYRSKEEEAAVEAQGGEVIKLGAKTTILFYNPEGKFQEKVEKARAKGIKVCTFKEFK